MSKSAKPKILFLTKYPEQGASSRYRVYQYLPHFMAFDFKCQALMSEAGFGLMYRDGQLFKKIWISLRDYLRRSLFLLWHLDAEVIYMQRELFAFGPLWAERLFRLLGKKLIFDLDDALFIHKQNRTNPFRWDKTARVKKILGLSDLVVAGNNWIREESLRLGAKQAVHIDVAEQVQETSPPGPSQERPLRALWLGSPTTSKYLKFIAGPLKQLQEEINLTLFIVGGDTALNLPSTAEWLPWSKENEQQYLRHCDIGLMPLPLENWSKGKCGGKARTYMASGLVPVVTDIGYNQELISHGVRGFLCRTEKDWIKAIRQIDSDRSLLETIPVTNYAYVREHFDQQQIARQIEQQILELLDQT